LDNRKTEIFAVYNMEASLSFGEGKRVRLYESQ
jgi:hypothetical protein